jgi:DNA polymerase-3 subunit alpha (Gram-positive type)
LIKLDVLGHDDPTIIRQLEELTGVDVSSIELDDAGTLALFSGLSSLDINEEQLGTDIGSLGVPEFGTSFVRQMLRDTRPQNFSELVRISGLSHGADVWLDNAQELIRSDTATLAEVIATRDDIMTNLIQWGMKPSQAFSIMEKVRKGRGLTATEEERMRELEVPGWYIESCKKIQYMFPKAHAVAYVMMALRIAYFKVHHPEAFYATYFTVRAGEFDCSYIGTAQELRQAISELQAKGSDATPKEKSLITVLKVALEMTLRGISFLPIDLQQSAAATFTLAETDEGQPALRCPFTSLQGLGTKAANSIVRERAKEPFSSVEDLVSRTRLSQSLVELLREQGALAELPSSDQVALF